MDAEAPSLHTISRSEIPIFQVKHAGSSMTVTSIVQGTIGRSLSYQLSRTLVTEYASFSFRMPVP